MTLGALDIWLDLACAAFPFFLLLLLLFGLVQCFNLDFGTMSPLRSTLGETEATQGPGSEPTTLFTTTKCVTF